MQDLVIFFDRFMDNLSLGEPQTSRIESAANGIMTFLRAEYGLTEKQVFMQGSYPNGTAVEPVQDGEYDVDIVAYCVDGETSPTAALNDLQRRFEGNGKYASRVVPKTPCVRLDYAKDIVGKFHVDVVPVRQNTDWASVAPLDAPRRGSEWNETAPQEYTNWCAVQGEHFARTVRIMKRWRDEQQPVRSAIKSIVLQVLVAECMPVNIADDQERVVETLDRLYWRLSSLSGPPAVINPVLPTENLARRWTQGAFESFVRELQEAVEICGHAASAADKLQAIDAWRELFGEDFPAMADTELGLQVSDYSHAEPFADKGWRVSLNPRYQVRVSAGIRRGRYGQVREIPEGQLLLPGSKLRFTTHLSTPNHVHVWWQVANTGGHARNDNGLRGEIFRAKSPAGQEWDQQAVNWESTKYTGVHLLRAMLVRDSAVVAVSEWRQVKIFARNHPFKL